VSNARSASALNRGVFTVDSEVIGVARIARSEIRAGRSIVFRFLRLVPIVFGGLPERFPDGLVGSLVGMAFGVFGLSQKLFLAHFLGS
jgi:hypothetical protein